MGGITDTVVGDTSLREVVCTNLGATVSCRHQTLASAGNIVDVLLVFAVVNEGVQTAQGTLLVLWLVASFGTLYEDFFHLARVRVLPGVAKTYTGLHLVDILTTGTTRTECIPLNITLVDVYLKLSASGSTATVAALVCIRP